MKLFLMLWGALVVATVSPFVAHAIVGPLPFDVVGVSVFGIVSNLVFAATLAVSIRLIQTPRLASIGTVLAIPCFLALCAASAFGGMFVYAHYPQLAFIMMSPTGTIGNYPSGADVPFDGGIQEWAVTAIAPIAMGLLGGQALRSMRRGTRTPPANLR
jgi:hypothetical protein